MGARPLSRVIQEKIKRPLAEELLFGKLTKGGLVLIDMDAGELVFEFEDEKRESRKRPSKQEVAE